MSRYSRSHLSDPDLRRDLKAHHATERGVTAEVIADLAEFDARKLYREDGYPSMFAWCLRELGYSEDAAYARIKVARASRRFPELRDAVGDGRLHLTGARLLAPHLDRTNAAELITAATRKTRAEIEALLAARFPRPDLAPMVWALPGIGTAAQLVSEPTPQVLLSASAPAPELVAAPVAPANVQELQKSPVPGRVEAANSHARLTPLATERYGVQFTIDQPTQDLLREVQDLLGHSVPAGDLAGVFRRGLESLARELRRSKFAASAKPRPHTERRSNDPRHIPAHVKRDVWKRDKGQCTFVGTNGHRCEARAGLEFDHELPVARGGWSSTSNVRLRCRAHNQYEAEREFGEGFMRTKRERALESRAIEAGRSAVGATRGRGRAQAEPAHEVPHYEEGPRKIDRQRRLGKMAERVGFEPTRRY